VTWITGSHHVLGIKHLLGKFWYSQSSVLLATTRCKRSESWHEEVETWEWYHVDSQFTEISVQLTGESEACGDSRHSGGDEMVQVTVCWSGEFQCSEADIVESFIVNTVCFIGVFYQLMYRECGIVWFYNGV